MRSRRNRKRRSPRPAERTSERDSNPFEGAETSGIAESPSAPGNSRRAFESLACPSRLLPLGLFLLGRSASSAGRCLLFTAGGLATRLNAASKCLHKVHDVCRLAPRRSLDWPAFLLLFEQLL